MLSFHFRAVNKNLKRADKYLTASLRLLMLEEKLDNYGYEISGLAEAAETLHIKARTLLKSCDYAQEPSYVSTHEAGHIVFALRNPDCGPLRNASIYPHKGIGGWVYIKQPLLDNLDQSALLDSIALNLAGFSAENIKYGESAFEKNRHPFAAFCTIEDTKDMVCARQMSALFLERFPHAGFLTIGDVIDEAQKIADKTIKDNWEMVARLEDELEKHYLLTTSDIMRVSSPVPHQPATPQHAQYQNEEPA